MTDEPSNAPLRVVLVDLEPQQAGHLDQVLTEAGFRVLACVAARSELFDRVTELEPDVVIASSGSARRDTLESLMNLSERYPRPVVLLSNHVDADLLAQASAAGVSAYAVQGVSSETLRSLIDVTVGHFEERERLRAELDTANRRLTERDEIGRAKCLLMERYAMNEDNAYRTMRNLAMARRDRLIGIARWILARGAL